MVVLCSYKEQSVRGGLGDVPLLEVQSREGRREDGIHPHNPQTLHPSKP